MADKMFLVVTLRKEVPDKATAKTIVQVVKDKLSDHPDVKVTSHTTDHFDIPEVPV
ncbi:hypothetical protein KAR91_84850 [Candidatus Pacearchaeota archaeon]|nr:hypothetical protein [Candidatus Pacearchaeota archaeon]